jgi:DNA-binding PadR family transcriptional regulator
MLSNDFATESIMLDHGFTSRLLTDLVSTGLVVLYRKPPNFGKKRVQVTYMITDAGRRALKATASVALVHRPRRRRVSSQRSASAAKIGTDDPGV